MNFMDTILALTSANLIKNIWTYIDICTVLCTRIRVHESCVYCLCNPFHPIVQKKYANDKKNVIECSGSRTVRAGKPFSSIQRISSELLLALKYYTRGLFIIVMCLLNACLCVNINLHKLNRIELLAYVISEVYLCDTQLHTMRCPSPNTLSNISNSISNGSKSKRTPAISDNWLNKMPMFNYTK